MASVADVYVVGKRMRGNLLSGTLGRTARVWKTQGEKELGIWKMLFYAGTREVGTWFVLSG
jgi:hypothetical protein